VTAKEDVMELLTYTVEEVAAMLGTARSATYEAVREGRIPAVRLGRRWLIPRERFHAWLNGAATTDAA
jgi:excisionase family DNA binding protein